MFKFFIEFNDEKKFCCASYKFEGDEITLLGLQEVTYTRGGALKTVFKKDTETIIAIIPGNYTAKSVAQDFFLPVVGGYKK